MRNSFKSGLFAAIGVTFALALSSGDALAGVTSVASKSVVSPPTSIEEAHYSRRPHRHYVRYSNHRRPLRRHHAVRYYRYGYDPAAAVITSAAAGIIAAGAYSPYYAYPYDYGYGYGYGYPSYGYGWGGGPVVYGGGWGHRPRFGGWGGGFPHGGGFHRVGGFGGGFHHGGGFGGGFHRGGGFGGGFHGGGFHGGGFHGGGFHGGGFHHGR